MPICARCLGVCIGNLLSLVLCVAFGLLPTLLAVMLMLPMGADWTAQRILGLKSTNMRRLLTGVLGGIGITALQLALVALVVRQFR